MKPAVDMLRKRDGIWAQHGLLTPLAPLPEVSRTQNGKLFDLGGGQLHLSTSIGPAHYYDEDWLEIDTTLRPVAGETYLRTEATPYICEVETDRVAWRYQSREGGTVEVELVEVDGDTTTHRFKLFLEPGL